MLSDRVMNVVVFDGYVLSLVRWYSLQSGRRLEEKRSFCDEMNR